MDYLFERRSYLFDVHAEPRGESGCTLVGTPIVYNNPADIAKLFREVIDQGALNGADLTDVPLIVNHNTSMIPVARSRRNTPNSTLRLIPTEQGLSFEADLDTEENMTARELASAVSRGDITGMSFRFSVRDAKWEGLRSAYPTRHVKKIGRIAEISAVTFPAYDATQISVRSREALESARSVLENARQEYRILLESRAKDLELEKLKIEILTK